MFPMVGRLVPRQPGDIMDDEKNLFPTLLTIGAAVIVIVLAAIAITSV